jgi:hypothetical protein
MADNVKSRRKRGWDADKDLRKNLPEWDKIYDTNGKVHKGTFEAMVKWMYQWTRDMNAWGQDLRDDLIRLEGQAGFALGDPGDPPGGPPNAD